MEFAPNDPKAIGLLGSLYSSTGRYTDGLKLQEAAVLANPDDGIAVANLAWMLATSPEAACRDGKRAVMLAKKVCDATGHRIPALLDTLAAAHAETGEFECSIEMAEKALVIVRRNPEASAVALEERRALYLNKSLWREP
jgi:tetratricopeptide (TPR) repeat protein